MSQEGINGFRDLFLLNPEIQNRLRLKFVGDDPVDVEACLDALVEEAKDNHLLFTKEELKAAIENFAKNLDGEAPACENMDPPKLSHMRDPVPARPAQGGLPEKKAKPKLLPVAETMKQDEGVKIVVDATLEFLNSEYEEEGPGICNW